MKVRQNDLLLLYFVLLIGLVSFVVLGCAAPRTTAQVEYRCKPAVNDSGEFVASASLAWN